MKNMAPARKAPPPSSRVKRLRPSVPAFCIAALCAILQGQEPTPGRGIQGALERFRQLLAACNQNLADQEKAWPDREKDQANEVPAPAAVGELQVKYRILLEKKTYLLGEVEHEAMDDIGPLLDALRETEDLSFLEALLPIAMKLGKEDGRTTKTLLEIARRLSPSPAFLIDALGKLENEEAAEFLLQEGKRRKDATIFAAAGQTGETFVIEDLIELADGGDKDLAQACLKAVTRLVPPSGCTKRRLEKLMESHAQELGSGEVTTRFLLESAAPALHSREIEELIVLQLRKVQSEELKAALTVYLGLFKEPGHLSFLESLYRETGSEKVRLAVLGAVGNAGAPGGGFLLETLPECRDSLPLQKACIHALGSTGHRAAVPPLIDLLKDPLLQRDARRALQRIAKQDFGLDAAGWLRWWRAQPEVLAKERDPDARELSG